MATKQTSGVLLEKQDVVEAIATQDNLDVAKQSDLATMATKPVSEALTIKSDPVTLAAGSVIVLKPEVDDLVRPISTDRNMALTHFKNIAPKPDLFDNALTTIEPDFDTVGTDIQSKEPGNGTMEPGGETMEIKLQFNKRPDFESFSFVSNESYLDKSLKFEMINKKNVCGREEPGSPKNKTKCPDSKLASKSTNKVSFKMSPHGRDTFEYSQALEYPHAQASVGSGPDSGPDIARIDGPDSSPGDMSNHKRRRPGYCTNVTCDKVANMTIADSCPHGHMQDDDLGMTSGAYLDRYDRLQLLLEEAERTLAARGRNHITMGTSTPPDRHPRPVWPSWSSGPRVKGCSGSSYSSYDEPSKWSQASLGMACAPQ